MDDIDITREWFLALERERRNVGEKTSSNEADREGVGRIVLEYELSVGFVLISSVFLQDGLCFSS